MTMRETAASRLSRLLSLVPWLEQHPGISVPEAAEHFGVSPEELERDLWLTICCGLPGHGPDQLIDIQFWDDDASIHVIDAQSLDRPLRLTSTEATALLIGLRLLAQVPGEHDRAALASATAKLEAAADVARGAVVVADEPGHDCAAQLARAIADARAVRLVYAGITRDEVTDRVVDPGALVRHSGRTYLTAWCRKAGAERIFRLDRILSAEVLDEPALPRAFAPGMPAIEGITVTLRVAPRSRWLLELLGASLASVDDEAPVETSVTVADPDWLVRTVLGQSGGIEVLEPPVVRQRVRVAAQAALDSLAGPDSPS
ncbi:MAG: WYL domain-containing protein [Actinobacteria bacterium]|nr:WYL domain-containing protein [Actinomycetota bacterium]